MNEGSEGWLEGRREGRNRKMDGTENMIEIPNIYKITTIMNILHLQVFFVLQPTVLVHVLTSEPANTGLTSSII